MLTANTTRQKIYDSIEEFFNKHGFIVYEGKENGEHEDIIATHRCETKIGERACFCIGYEETDLDDVLNTIHESLEMHIMNKDYIETPIMNVAKKRIKARCIFLTVDNTGIRCKSIKDHPLMRITYRPAYVIMKA